MVEKVNETTGRIVHMKIDSIQLEKSEINKAGNILVNITSNRDKLMWAADMLSGWRASHNYPINTFQATLRMKLKAIDRNALVAQRLKRIPSIVDKLRRFPTMKLAQMQDIGGLRAVVGSLRQVEQLYKSYKNSQFKHELVSEKDYIDKPKVSGYRSIHLVYKYNNVNVPEYNELMVELQIRTRQQHAWATAVETMGTFLDYSLKSSEGPEEWLHFFALTGSAFAQIEKRNPVPSFEKLTRDETFEAVIAKERQLKVHEKLSAFGIAIDAIHSDSRKGSYYLLILDPR